MSEKLKYPLFLLRLSIFFVMIVATLIKLIHPEGLALILSYTSVLPALSPVVIKLLGFVELVILCGFLIGYQKKITYGLVLLMNLLSLVPIVHVFLNILNPAYFMFLFLLPVIAGSYVLYMFREYDTFYTFV